MRGLLALLLLGAVSLGLLSCAAPFLERAIDPPGFSGGIGIEGVADLASPSIPEGFEAEYIAMPIVFVRYRYPNPGRVTLGLRGGYGIGIQTHSSPLFGPSFGHYETLRTPTGELEASLKVQTDDQSSIKAAIGAIGFLRHGLYSAPPHVDLDYLHDFSPFLTGDIGIGVPRILKLGVAIHPRLSRYLVSHIAVQGAAFSSVGLGLGIDVLPSDRE
jgi:hypothetical protein